jgi:hypothetical protein
MSKPEFPKIDRSAFSITTLQEQDAEDKRYWLSKSPEERLAAMELMRQINYDYDPIADRVSRVLEIVEQTSS